MKGALTRVMGGQVDKIKVVLEKYRRKCVRLQYSSVLPVHYNLSVVYGKSEDGPKSRSI